MAVCKDSGVAQLRIRQARGFADHQAQLIWAHGQKYSNP
jgi:hypothetical protein